MRPGTDQQAKLDVDRRAMVRNLAILIAVLVGSIVWLAFETQDRPSPAREDGPIRLEARNRLSPEAGPDKPHPPAQASGSLEAFQVEAREMAAGLVAAGFDSRDEIVESIVEVIGMDYEGLPVSEHAERITDALFAAHRKAEATWTTTDCDRLIWAFAKLEERGILAGEKVACCMTCGHAEMHERMAKAIAKGRPIRGYVFYHDQDAEYAADGEIYLAYSASSDDDQAAIAIAKETIQVLEQAGLKTAWNGSVQQRIGVVDMDWRRRRFSEPIPPHPTQGAN